MSTLGRVFSPVVVVVIVVVFVVVVLVVKIPCWLFVVQFNMTNARAGHYGRTMNRIKLYQTSRSQFLQDKMYALFQ